VAPSGGDATSIADAIALVSALNPAPSVNDPAAIVVYPGNYITTPFVVPSHVTVANVAGANTALLIAASPTSVLCELQDAAGIRGLGLIGANGVGGTALKVGAGASAGFDSLVLLDNTIGIHVSGVGAKTIGSNLHISRRTGDAGDIAVLCDGGAEANLRGVFIRGTSGTNFVKAVHVTGTDSKGILTFYADFCDTGLLIDLGASAQSASVMLDNCGTALEVADAYFQCSSLGVTNSGSLDFLTSSVDAVVRVSSALLRHDKVSLINGADVIIAHVSETKGDESFRVVGELQVGTEKQGAETCLGGGDSHTRGMVVQTNTNGEVGTWNDITDTVKIQNGSVDLFPGVVAGNVCYIGGIQKFQGIKVLITSAMSLGGGGIDLQYWNGSTWTSIISLSTNADAPYNQYGQSHLVRADSEQIRFNDFLGTWELKSLNGSSLYWVRFVVTSDITAPPAADVIKLHTNRMEVNADGVPEFFGAGEQRRDLFWHPELEESLNGAVPASTDTAYTTNITANTVANVFSSNALDGRMGKVAIPEGLDTSKPVEFTIAWKPSDAGAGNVELEKRHGVLNEGDSVNGSVSDVLQSEVIAVSGQQDELIFTKFSFFIPDALPGELLVLSYFRDGTAGNLDDTYGGAIERVFTRLTGVFWK
jgi:hypothetical protein